MFPAQPLALLRLPVAVAAFFVLAALFLFPGQAYAQNAPTISGDATASVAENTATTGAIKPESTEGVGVGGLLIA